MVPTKVLNHFTVGDTVTLKGAMIYKASPLFIGGINEDGYYLLWKSAEHHQAGKPWEHAASGSHQVSPP